MKSVRFFRVLIAVFVTCALLSGTALAQRPTPPRPHSPAAHPTYVPKTYAAQASAAQMLSAAALGAPGLSYRYVSTTGETDAPYLADAAHLNRPLGIAIDPSSSDFLITEQMGKRVLRYQADGTYTWAIGAAGIGVTDDYLFSDPHNVAVAPDGHVWVADSSRIVEYDADGVFLREVAGADRWAQGSDNNQFAQPEAIAFDDQGHMFVADRYNQRVQVFDWAAGTDPVYNTTLGETGVTGNSLNPLHLDQPVGVAAAASGQLYISDMNNQRVLTCPYNSGNGTWACGVLASGVNVPSGLAFIEPNFLYFMDGNGHFVKCTGSSCSSFSNNAWGTNLVVDGGGNLYVTREWDCVVDQYDPDGYELGAYFGDWNTCYLTDENHFYQPRVEVDSSGNLLVLEEAGQRLSKFSPSGAFLWSVGEPGCDTWDDDHFNWPHGLDTDKNGNIYVADSWRVKTYNKNGVLVHILGNPPDQPNPLFSWVTDVAVDPNNGNIYAVDNHHDHVLVFNSAYAQIGKIGKTDIWGPGNDRFGGAVGVEVDANSNIYVTDWGNNRVQKFNSSRAYVKTFGVTGSNGEQHDQISGPDDVLVDGAGRVFVADMNNNRVQVFDAAGAYLATVGGNWGSRDGDFRQVSDVSMGPDGSLYVSDLSTARVQKFSPGVPGWRQKNLNGFGRRFDSGVSALEVYNGKLYAGTGNWNDGNGGSLWSSPDGTTWSQERAPGQITSGDNPDITDMQVFNGKLYVSTAWGNNLAQLWRYNGSSWEKVRERASNGFSVMAVFNNMLYVGNLGAPDEGASIWRSATGNNAPADWETMAAGGNGNPHNVGFGGLAEFGGRLYASITNEKDGMEIWRMNAAGTAWDTMLSGGMGDAETYDPSGFGVLNGELYVSGQNNTTGAKMWKTSDGSAWDWVTTNGFNDADNLKFEALFPFHGRFYAASKNLAAGLQLWVTDDGSDWQPYLTGGFGDALNDATLWNAANAIFQDSLYMGTWNGSKGGQIWQMLPYTTYLPNAIR